MASIEFPTDVFEEDVRPPITLFDIVFTVIAVLAAGFSGYTTYLGFSYDLPHFASLAIAVIIGLGLLAITFKIREHRLAGDSIKNPLIAFTMFFVFSFISNTNAIYTYFLQNDIVGETQVEAWANFDKGTSNILAAIDNSKVVVDGARTKEKLDIARKNLMLQITDSDNTGLGEKARAHLQQVEEILGVKLTQLKPPAANSSFSRFEEYAGRLDQLILDQYNSKYSTGVTKQIADFRAKVITLKEFYEGKVNSKQYSSDTTDLMKMDLDSLKVQATKLISFEGSVPTINVTADDIGSFQYTWVNFVNGINISAIVLSVLLSIMLDILAPALSLLLYKRELEL